MCRFPQDCRLPKLPVLPIVFEFSEIGGYVFGRSGQDLSFRPKNGFSEASQDIQSKMEWVREEYPTNRLLIYPKRCKMEVFGKLLLKSIPNVGNWESENHFVQPFWGSCSSL